jgi:splicing factor 3A subunit 1
MFTIERFDRQEPGAIGPGIGPAAAPPPPITGLPPAPASLPAPPNQMLSAPAPAYPTATVSSGPQPSSLFPPQPAPVMLPPLHYQGMDAAQPFGYQPPPAGVSPALAMHPARLAALGVAGPMVMPQAGIVRTADEMQAGNPDELPPPKRQKIAKLPGGQLYPEADWISMHPVRSFGISHSCDHPC